LERINAVRRVEPVDGLVGVGAFETLSDREHRESRVDRERPHHFALTAPSCKHKCCAS
jgi:hypothetical protein